MNEAEDLNDMFCKNAINLNCVFFNVGFRNGPEVKAPGRRRQRAERRARGRHRARVGAERVRRGGSGSDEVSARAFSGVESDRREKKLGGGGASLRA